MRHTTPKTHLQCFYHVYVLISFHVQDDVLFFHHVVPADNDHGGRNDRADQLLEDLWCKRSVSFSSSSCHHPFYVRCHPVNRLEFCDKELQ